MYLRIELEDDFSASQEADIFMEIIPYFQFQNFIKQVVNYRAVKVNANQLTPRSNDLQA